MKRTVILAALLAATSLVSPAALAADLPRKAPAYVSPPPPQDWSGVYVGLQGGYGWGHQSVDAISPGDCFANCFIRFSAVDGDIINGGEPASYPDVALPSTKQRGWLFGGFAGVQKQWGSWVLGIEGDFDGANIKGSATSSAVSQFDVSRDSEGGPIICHNCLSLTHGVSLDSKIDELGSLRGKVGFVPAPNWLIYGTGGLAFAHVTNAFTDTESFVRTIDVEGTTVVADHGTDRSIGGSGGASMLGWAVGGGVDWKFPIDAGSAWVFGVEYLHYQFPTNTITLTDNFAFDHISFNTTERVDTIKGRISYLFSIH